MKLKPENYQQFFESTREPVFWFDREGKILFANSATIQAYGYSEQELLEQIVTDIVATLPVDKWDEFFASVADGNCKSINTSIISKDGSRFPALAEFTLARQGNDVYVCAFVRNKPDDNHTLQQIELLSSAVQVSKDAFFLNSKDGRIIYANKTACEMLGYTNEELVSMKTSDIDHGEVIDDKGSIMINGRILDHKQGVFESQHWKKDGSVIPVEVSYNNLVVGGVEYSYAFCRDISERRELESQKDQLQFFIDHSLDAVYLYDRKGRILYANETAVSKTGYSREELMSMSVLDLDPSITKETWEQGWLSAIQGKDLLFDSVHRRKDGSEYPVEISFTHTRSGETVIASAFVRDITDRKQASSEAEELRFVVENSIDQVFIYDRKGRFHYVNNSACESLGYTRDELMQLTLLDIVPGHSQEAMDRNWKVRQDGKKSVLESVHMTKDGKLIPVEIAAHTTSIGGEDYSCAFVRDITERKQAMQKLVILQFAIDNSIAPVYFYDKDANITYANKSACQALGYTFEELTSMSVLDIDPGLTEDYWKSLYKNVKAGLISTVPSTNQRKDGTIFPVEVTPTNMTFGDLEFGCSVNIDISDRIEAETALRESEEKFRLIAETSPVSLMIYRVSDDIVLFANKAAENLFKRKVNTMVGLPVTALFDDRDSKNVFVTLVSSGDQINGQEFMLGKTGSEPIWVSLNTKAIELHGEQFVCCAMQDVTDAHNLSMQLSYQATYDSLTGLVNRREFESRLKRVITTAEQKGTDNALCYLDLDQFKVINDTCGHIAGDELLRQLGNVLQSQIRKRDTLARLGGDEFAVLLENCSLNQAKRVANAIRDAIQEYRFVWDNKSFNIGVSIGLVPIDLEDENITEVLRRADTACYQAKENGRNRIHIYHPADEELSQRHGEMQWVTRISSALEQNRLQLWTQKIISIGEEENNKEHYELLLRLVNEDKSTIPPGAFLPAAERYNLAARIDRWVVRATLKWFACHPDKYDVLKMCAINLSGQSLNDEELLQGIIDAFNKYQLVPEKFCFEVTETAAIANLNSATKFINSLKELGCSFALDDFGSGLSSFAYLKNLPVDYIKIDGMFIKDMHSDPMHLALVKSINEVGHAMGKKTIAEFVENKKILKKLGELGVDFAQGYGVAKPNLMIEGVADELLLN